MSKKERRMTVQQNGESTDHADEPNLSMSPHKETEVEMQNKVVAVVS